MFEHQFDKQWTSTNLQVFSAQAYNEGNFDVALLYIKAALYLYVEADASKNIPINWFTRLIACLKEVGDKERVLKTYDIAEEYYNTHISDYSAKDIEQLKTDRYYYLKRIK